jgi:hypothetical protein
MLDRCYLARGMPTLLVWGSRDSVLPVGHAYQARAAMPGSRLEIFDGAGHFPFRTDPHRFVSVLEEFCATTEPAEWGVDDWRTLLQQGRPAAVAFGEPARYEAELRAASERSAT